MFCPKTEGKISPLSGRYYLVAPYAVDYLMFFVDSCISQSQKSMPINNDLSESNFGKNIMTLRVRIYSLISPIKISWSPPFFPGGYFLCQV